MNPFDLGQNIINAGNVVPMNQVSKKRIDGVAFSNNDTSFRQDELVNYWKSWSLCDSRNKRQTSETVDKNLIDINTSRNDSVKLKAITALKKDTNLVTTLDEADPAKSVSGRQIDADEWCDDLVSGGNTEQRD
ncbi:hypothetical protein DUI87_16906 [Hirundo rustica rustica]|uniref:Uncharacterized protein n=1 Tax=Hirundo rustica rustica TaxID=333673 RepID=A0A3M0KJQ8_HIRRU|nr:hypothetical protein DUI87_16906 [Hirundo rustica rustica]